MVSQRELFKQYVQHLQHKKLEYLELKNENMKEREDIKKAAKQAEQFKFTKMTKKISFLPALKERPVFQKQNSVHAVGAPFMDHRDKLKLMAPDKTIMRETNKWALQKTCDGELFQNSVRQEKDIYDLDLLKYMKTYERGIKRPHFNVTTMSAIGNKTNSETIIKPKVNITSAMSVQEQTLS